MSHHTCVACDEKRHGDCDGTAIYIDQDGHSRYVCECHCRREIIVAARMRDNESKVRSLIRQLGMEHTHELVAKATP